MFVRLPARATIAVNGWLWRCYRSSHTAARHTVSLATAAGAGAGRSRVVRSSSPMVAAVTRSITTQDDIRKYKNDSATLARWLDVSIVQRKGRAFDANSSLIDASDADTFPTLQAHGLNGTEISIPAGIPGKAKLVVFSFKHYGFSLIRSWIDPYIARYVDTTTTTDSTVVGEKKGVSDDDAAVAAVAFEICFIEYGFLSIAKSVFVNNIRNSIDPSQIDRTAIVFGGVKEFAAPLLLPNVYTGYAFLLDRDNKIRWKASGLALDHEVQSLLDCTDELLRSP